VKAKVTRRKRKMSKIIGIDLGTTNSCVSVMEGGKPTVIANAEGVRTTPSIVAFTKSGERLVGEPAKRQAVTNAERTISSIKRHMGSDYKVSIDGKNYTPQEISAMILQKLKADAEAYLGEKVTEAVITVPAYFNDAQRQATKDAGKIAGLDVKRIINEPTSAALAYGLDNEKEQKILVFDCGGGTHDVSVIEIGDGVIEVLSTNGDTHLGGDDVDKILMDYIVGEFKKAEGVDVSGDKMAMQRIKEAAEKAKKELSSAATTNINLPFITATADGPKHLDMNISRAKFEELISGFVDKTIVPVDNALKDAGLSKSDIDKILLVGGSTRIPLIQERLAKHMGKEPSKSLNPDECVSIGACIQGGKLAGDKGAGDILLLDVTPLSLAIETMGGVATVIIPRNTTIPTKASQVFSTATDNQSAVDIHVTQGERQFSRDNKTLGQFRLDGILPARRGVPQIEVTFDIDANGIINVTAKDLGTGKDQHITITSGSNMSKEDIDKAVKEAAQYEAEDKKRRENIDAKNELESAVINLRKTLEDVKDKVDSGVVSELEDMFKRADELTANQNPSDSEYEEMKELKQKIMDKFQSVTEKIYQTPNDAQTSTSNDSANQNTTNGNADYVDGDFKEV